MFNSWTLWADDDDDDGFLIKFMIFFSLFMRTYIIIGAVVCPA